MTGDSVDKKISKLNVPEKLCCDYKSAVKGDKSFCWVSSFYNNFFEKEGFFLTDFIK